MNIIIEQANRPGGTSGTSGGANRPGGTSGTSGGANRPGGTSGTSGGANRPGGTSGSGTSGTSGSSTPRKRGNPLNTQDYEGINFKYKYPGDKNYRYGVKGTDWYAKNINNQKVFNISKDGFTSSVDNLNRQFPNAFKEVVQPTTPETPTQDSTKVVTNVPPVKPVDSANTGTPVKPVDSANTGTNIPPQVKFVDSTTYKLEKI